MSFCFLTASACAARHESTVLLGRPTDACTRSHVFPDPTNEARSPSAESGAAFVRLFGQGHQGAHGRTIARARLVSWPGGARPLIQSRRPRHERSRDPRLLREWHRDRAPERGGALLGGFPDVFCVLKAARGNPRRPSPFWGSGPPAGGDEDRNRRAEDDGSHRGMAPARRSLVAEARRAPVAIGAEEEKRRSWR
jgi:hypothetical protein